MPHSRTRTLIAFFIASLSAILIACFSHSQFVLNELVILGVVIPANVRIGFTLDDLIGLLPTYGAIITLGLAIAFSISAWLVRRATLPAIILYPLAGVVTLAAILSLMHPVLEITLIAGARSSTGFISQCLAGGIAGWVFALLTGNTQHPR